MMGLMILGVLAVYLIVSIWVTQAAAGWAIANNKKPWLWGGLAAFMMYNLVFWDLIPTLVMHKYYCSTQAGFWVYKTPEQWLRENPELTAEDLKSHGERVSWNKFKWQFPNKKVSSNPERFETMINGRIYIADTVFESALEVLHIGKRTFYISDIKSGQKLAEDITFGFGYGGYSNLEGFIKEGLSKTSCEDGGGKQTSEYINFIERIIGLRKTK